MPAGIGAASGPDLPADALAAWLEAAGQSGGLAADFATSATAATWRDDALEVTIPTAQALSFLNRPEVAAGIARALAAVAGRAVAIRLVAGAAAGDAESGATAARTGTAEPAPRPVPPPTQAALLRDAAGHPLVARAAEVFDAAIRRVEPPRTRPSAPATVDPPAGNADGESAAADAVPQHVGEGIDG